MVSPHKQLLLIPFLKSKKRKRRKNRKSSVRNNQLLQMTREQIMLVLDCATSTCPKPNLIKFDAAMRTKDRQAKQGNRNFQIQFYFTSFIVCMIKVKNMGLVLKKSIQAKTRVDLSEKKCRLKKWNIVPQFDLNP